VRESADNIGRALVATSFTYRLLHRLDMLAVGGRVVDLFNGHVFFGLEVYNNWLEQVEYELIRQCARETGVPERTISRKVKQFEDPYQRRQET